MTPEVLRLLQQFEVRQQLGVACLNALGNRKHIAAGQWVIDAYRKGWLVLGLTVRGDRDTDPVIDSDRLFDREFVLTEEGCIAVGLKVRPVVIEPRKVKTLFDMEG